MKTVLFSSTLLAAALLTGCGTSSEGSRYNAQHGVAQDSGYPSGAKPTDAESPALGGLPKEEKHEGAAEHKAEGEKSGSGKSRETKKAE